MSDTPISPGVGAATLAGVAASIGLLIAPFGAALGLSGAAPTVVGGTAAPSASWTLGAGSIGAATPALSWRQARIAIAGVFGALASLLIQGSVDGQTWSTLCATADGVRFTASGALGATKVLPVTGGVVLATDWSGGFRYLRPVLQGGDASSSLSVTANISPTGGAV
jgi:hypothetical protein